MEINSDIKIKSSGFFTKKEVATGSAKVGGKTYSFNIEIPKNLSKKQDEIKKYVEQ